MSTEPPELFGTQELRAQDIQNLMNETRNFGQMGKFRIRGILGRGGCAIVYRAVDPDGADVALKVISMDDGLAQSDFERFIREAKSLAKLRNHPYIVHVYEAGKDGKNYFIAMDNIGNGNNVTRLVEEGGPLDVDQALDMAIKIAEALEHVHNLGFVHRDIKPSNILIDADGNPVLSDFGLVQVFNSNLTLDGAILGTPGYLAPEVLEEGSSKTHVTTDMYSFGMVVYKMLTGRLPFDIEGDIPLGKILDILQSEKPKDPSEFGVELPKNLIAILFKLIEREPEDRYQLMEEVLEDLRSCRHGGKVKARLPTFADLVDRWVRAHKVIAMLTAAALIGALGIALIVVSEYKTRQQEAILEHLHEVNRRSNEKTGDDAAINLKACLDLMATGDLTAAEEALGKLVDWAEANGAANTALLAKAALARIALARNRHDDAREVFAEIAASAPKGSFEQELFTFETGVCLWLRGNKVAAQAKWKPLADNVSAEDAGSYIAQLCSFLTGKTDEQQLQHAMSSASDTFKALGLWAIAQHEQRATRKLDYMKKAVAQGGHYFVWIRMEEKQDE